MNDNILENVVDELMQLSEPKFFNTIMLLNLVTARANEMNQEIDLLRKKLNETYVDENDTTWTRASAWAYAMACKALEKNRLRVHQLEESNAKMQQNIFELVNALEKVTTERNESDLLLKDCVPYNFEGRQIVVDKVFLEHYHRMMNALGFAITSHPGRIGGQSIERTQHTK